MAATNFFVSYTGADEAWAEWIAFALERAGFTTVIQAWDFRPGSNFVIEMQNAARYSITHHHGPFTSLRSVPICRT